MVAGNCHVGKERVNPAETLGGVPLSPPVANVEEPRAALSLTTASLSHPLAIVVTADLSRPLTILGACLRRSGLAA